MFNVNMKQILRIVNIPSMSTKQRFLSYLLILSAFSSQLLAQEYAGLYSSNYSGVSSISKNPAMAVARYPLTWDLNLASVGASIETNYVFLHNASLFDVIQTNELLGPASDDNLESIHYHFSSNIDKTAFLVENINIGGPSFLLKAKNQSFGIFTNFRNNLSVNRVSSNLYHYHYTNASDLNYFSIDPFKVGFLNWAEIGLHYGIQLNKSLSVGANVKYIAAYDAIFLNNLSEISMSKDGDDLLFENADLYFGMAGNLEIENESNPYNLKRNGSGVGLDLGVNYLYKNSKNLPYKFSIGASLIDIGFARFNKKAEAHEIETNNPFVIRTGEFKDETDHVKLIDLIFEQSTEAEIVAEEGIFYNSSDHTEFNIWLPTGIVIQADYAFTNYFYTSAALVQRIRLKGAMAERSNSINITPRFESRWLDVAFPLNIVNDTKSNWGFAIRLAFLTIGSDNLQSLLKTDQFTGTDLYASIKVNPFDLNFNKKSMIKSHGSKSSVSCPKL